MSILNAPHNIYCEDLPRFSDRIILSAITHRCRKDERRERVRQRIQAFHCVCQRRAMAPDCEWLVMAFLGWDLSADPPPTSSLLSDATCLRTGQLNPYYMFVQPQVFYLGLRYACINCRPNEEEMRRYAYCWSKLQGKDPGMVCGRRRPCRYHEQNLATTSTRSMYTRTIHDQGSGAEWGLFEARTR